MVRISAFDTLKQDSTAIAIETMIVIAKQFAAGTAARESLFGLRDELVATRVGVEKWVAKAAAKRPLPWQRRS